MVNYYGGSISKKQDEIIEAIKVNTEKIEQQISDIPQRTSEIHQEYQYGNIPIGVTEEELEELKKTRLAQLGRPEISPMQ